MTTARTIPVWKSADDLSKWFVTDLDSHALDVVVVGAGIAGLSAALCLLREGRKVVVVDKEGIGAGETLRTSAHLSNALDDRYYRLARQHGGDGARLAAASHAAAIDWIEAADNYVKLHCGRTTHVLGETLTSLERRLDPSQFLRVHRSRMVSRGRVVAVHVLLGGTYDLELRDGTRLTSGRQYRDAVQKFLRP